MPLVFRYYQPGLDGGYPTSVDLGNAVVRFGNMALTYAAAIGDPAMSTLEIDDPDGTLSFNGLRYVTVTETSAPSNNRIVWSGVTQDRRVGRADSMRTGAARRYTLELADTNWILGRRIFVNAAANRPAETAGDRIRWILAAGIGLYDRGHVTYPTTAMDAVDYRGQRVKDLIADCALAAGFNFWVAVHEASGLVELFFQDPDDTSYTGSLAISNDPDDVDSSTTFAPYEDAELTRSPSRIAAGVYLPYSGGFVYVNSEATGSAYTYIDQAAPMANVKTAAKALPIAQRFLADNAEEDDKITCAIKVPVASVNAVRAGQVINAKFTHLPGYETARQVRVIRRTVVQEEEGGQHYYKLALDLSPVAAAPGLIDWIWVVTNAGYVDLDWTPTAGNYLVMLKAMRDTGANPSNKPFADLNQDGGHDADETYWTYITGGGAGGILSDGMEAWYTPAVGNEVRIRYGDGGSKTPILIAEVSGSSLGYAAYTQYSASTSWVGPSVSPTGPAVVLGMLAGGEDTPPAQTLTTNAAWTELGNSYTSFHPQTLAMSKAVAAAGTYSPTGTCATSEKYAGITVVIT
jgi:hypothetical protein